MNILGIRELTIDFNISNDNNIVYGGGGTSHNVIWNLRNSFNVYIGGVSGNDIFAKTEIENLKANNINTDFLKIKNKKSKKVYITLNKGESVNSVKCPKCQKDVYKSSSIYTIDYSLLKKHNIECIVFDSYKQENIEIVKKVKGKIKTILDLGVIGNLRYMSIDKINELKNINFDLIQMNKKVSSFLKSRLNLKSNRELFEFLNPELLVLTDAENGSYILSKTNECKISFKVEKEQIMDNNGAGDAFLAASIESYMDKGEYGIDNTCNIDKVFNKYVLSLEKLAKEKVTNVLKTKGARYQYPYTQFEVSSNLDDVCSMCLSKTTVKKTDSKYKITTAVEKMYTRIINGVNSKNIKQLQEILKNIEEQKIAIIGSGASYVASNYIKTVINEYTKGYAAIFYLNEVINNNTITKFDKYIIISSSGNSPDVKKALDVLMTKEKQIYLITAKKESTIALELKEIKNLQIISYYSDKWTRERGFLSIEGITLPVILLIFSILNLNKSEIISLLKQAKNTYISNIQKHILEFKNILKYPMLIDIYYNNMTHPFALDLESKLIEAGMARVSLHDKKNFSHGRFSILKSIKSNLAIILDNQSGYDKYDQKLIEYICNKQINIMYLINITNEDSNLNSKLYQNLTSYYINILNIQEVIAEIAQIVKIDLSNPGYDNLDSKLYEYK